jgi:putative lipoic acid-binding regulatory protein
MPENNFEEFKVKLEKEHQFPCVYMFKFIIPADNKKMAMTEAIFNEDVEITQKTSSTGKYISITAKQVSINADEIIQVYKKALEIEGLMAF